MSKLGPISHFLSPLSCDSLVLQGLRCSIWCYHSHSLILVTGSSTWHLMAKNSEDLKKRMVALHKDGVGYKKIAKTLKLSCSTFVASGLDINGCVLSYFEGTANLYCYTSCTLTTLHCSKVSFLQCCHMKRYNKIFTKMWGVYSLLWDTVHAFIFITCSNFWLFKTAQNPVRLELLIRFSYLTIAIFV